MLWIDKGEITKFSTLSCNKKFGLGDYESNSADNLISLVRLGKWFWRTSELTGSHGQC